MITFYKRFFIVILVFTVFLFTTSCKEEKKQSYDGKIYDISLKGDNSLTAESKKIGNSYELTIKGSGAAKSYAKKELVPWNVISKKISSVKIEEGITNIGDFYFCALTISSYIIPKSVVKIEKNSFNEMAKIYSYQNEPFENEANNEIFYYSSEFKTGVNKYWHMVGENPIVWKTYKVMFIGNSFTYYPYKDTNPAVVELTKSLTESLGIDVKYDFVIKGAHTLKKFADANDEKGKIVDSKLRSASDYDFIILQEQSTAPVTGYNNFKQGVSLLLDKIKETQTNCEVILYATWGFPSGLNQTNFTSVEVMESLIREAYQNCADEFNLRISHVGEAFTYVYKNHKDINLYTSDLKHQNYAGSFLSACVHVCNLFNIDVRSSSFTGELTKGQADILKSVAYDIVLK